jgi:hypothetical protein
MSTRLTREQFAQLPPEMQDRIKNHPMCQGDISCTPTAGASILKETKASALEETSFAGAVNELGKGRPVRFTAADIADHDERFRNPSRNPENHHSVKLVGVAPKKLQDELGIHFIGQDPSHTQDSQTKKAVEGLATRLGKRFDQLTPEDLKTLEQPELFTRGYTKDEVEHARQSHLTTESSLDDMSETVTMRPKFEKAKETQSLWQRISSKFGGQ